MNLGELITSFRSRADDSAQPYLWSDDEVTLYLNDAQNEAATRALLIQDNTSALVVNINLVAGQSEYKLHPSILEIITAKLNSTGKPLTITSLEKLENAGYNVDATGTPEYIYENDDGTVSIKRIPVEADVIKLRVKRLPLCPMSKELDKPEIHVRYHSRMIDWALRCAYLKPDSETYNKDAADRHEMMFERSFGVFKDANVQRKQRDKSPNNVKSNW